MSNPQNTYEQALEDVLVALRANAQRTGEDAQVILDSDEYDAVQGATAVGEQTGAVNAYLLVNKMLNDYRKAGVA